MKNDVIRGLTEDADERMHLAHLLDCRDAAERRGVPAHTDFLTPHERALAERLAPEAVFCGGVPDAERTVAVFLPEWAPAEDAERCAGLAALRIERRDAGRGGALTHRDYLGAILALGLRRDAVGELLVREDGCDAVVTEAAAALLVRELESVGRVPVRTERTERVGAREQRFEERRDTVASARLDALTAAAFSLARGRAAEAVEAGRVFVNGALCEKPDREVRSGDRIALRGAGKCEILIPGGVSRKGRLCVVIRRFL